MVSFSSRVLSTFCEWHTSHTMIPSHPEGERAGNPLTQRTGPEIFKTAVLRMSSSHDGQFMRRTGALDWGVKWS